MVSDPNFEMNQHRFDVISELSNSESSSHYFDILFILSGIFSFLFLRLYYFSQKELYYNLPNWLIAKFLAYMGSSALFFIGIFDDNVHPAHLLAVASAMSGFAGFLVLVSMDLDDYYHNMQRNQNYMVKWGYVLTTYSMFNIFVFRFSPYRGLLQFFIIIFIISWFIWEAVSYNRFELWVNTTETWIPIQFKINPITYLMQFFAFILILNAYVFTFMLDSEIIPCEADDPRCSKPNVISMVGAALVLIILSFKLQLRVRSKNSTQNQKLIN
jgi:hypothetical protein